MTGALKNLFGVVPGFRKAEYHVTHPDLEGFSRMLADLNGLVRSSLVVMDAIRGMEGNGPRAGTPVDVGLLIVSDDPVAVDAVACRVAGIDPARVPLLAMAEEAGVGRAAPGRIELRGDPVEGLAPRRFVLPPSNLARKVPPVLFRWAKNLMVPKPVIVPSLCRRCGECVKACPVQPKALAQEAGGVPRYTYGRCIRCFCCQEACPHRAIEILPAPLAGLFDRG
jgi:ferredoxin